MAQSDFTEAMSSAASGCEMTCEQPVQFTNVMTGGLDYNRYLYHQLKCSMQRADRIDMIVSFLMESGVRMVLKDLKQALQRGVQIRVLTGNYLGITQPAALYLLKKELGDGVDLRFYQDKNRSFHPKSYIFHYPAYSEIYIGSSNISRSALTSGIEWNYRFTTKTNPEDFQLFLDTFEDLFSNHAIVIDDAELRRYSKSWHKPAVFKDLARYDMDEPEAQTVTVTPLFQPRGAQIEALYALADSRAEGATKALVQAATGIGKTYLAAFDSASYERILFVAHREEILKQAARSFRNVRHSDDYGFFDRSQKNTHQSVIFASVATLGKPEYLNKRYFAPDFFDYIVIDEFHHAVTKSYQNIVSYFTPKFLLGLTATPERMDGKNIYEICDYNVPYEISLQEAINKGMLVPFHYYGIYDETDYSGLHLVKGQYDTKDLEQIYRGNAQRYDLIYKYYMKYGSRQALGFCCSRKHAEAMAEEFCRRGIPAAAVYSNADGEYSEARDEAIRKLRNQELRVIFCVDMFNEGVDIASLDMVMFLRPTESPTVFLQQLGRGLRIYPGKQYLTVLDFIGNYEKAGRVTFLLSDSKSQAAQQAGYVSQYNRMQYHDDCIVDFDMRLIDLFDEMDKKTMPMKNRIQAEYFRVKELLEGKVPTRMEFFTYMDDDVYQYCMTHAKDNPFRAYLEFLHRLDELTADERVLYSGIGREFIHVMETTNMQKVYKMPILYSFYHHGHVRLEVTDEEVLNSWKEFFDTGTNWKDFSDDITYAKYRSMTDAQHLTKAKNMPIHFLIQSGKGFFVKKDGYAIALREELREVIHNPALAKHMEDILAYRTMEYYRRRYTETEE